MKLPLTGNPRIVRSGSKEGVFEAFPKEVRALRAAHVQTRLIVVIDGDELLDARVRDRLRQKLKEAGLEEDFSNDAILIVRPCWEMENWALHLLGEPIGERHEDSAGRRLGDRARHAGRKLADACKSGRLPDSPLPSMIVACDEWKAHRQRWDY